ncbi:bifunctional nucleoside/nucleotide kinase/histidine phosphatase family protein [Megalodesulfovibrio gigas]|uniref:Putative fructose-2,6-bisphosphatase n=1 Tax=Megalodesulfovibrio gigas (strain ATCC 19364 / DSM 1382 / NCIMB 9332 / VKM B-1759) TaxID=1121448 RepID=T2GCW9_MEGG1|nr:6-phosphofructo-2-kinase/fructose-2,6-bisphosphatase [Megalodesulfovibrio gigas]AGW14019.1 putative fructose-2,6-bisphosphatase [Megalodesulfovibrio gigas DSM 1382 = ATCC 19364]
MATAGKLYIVLMGLPATGKSVLARKLQETLAGDGRAVRTFNNGDVRRRLFPRNTSFAEFYNPDNAQYSALRDEIALINLYEAKNWLQDGGEIAILDATNVSRARRAKIESHLHEHPILYIETVNNDPELYAYSIDRKTRLPEFSHLSYEEARQSFEDRINFYRKLYTPLNDERNHLVLDTLNNRVLKEHIQDRFPHYFQIRDLLVADWVKGLYLVRHGETTWNAEQRIGGDPLLNDHGNCQARAMAEHLKSLPLGFIFTSSKQRSRQMAEPLLCARPEARHMVIKEFDEIHAGICEGMTYEEMRRTLPQEFAARSADKYQYTYPGGESYATLQSRVDRGLKKALWIAGVSQNICIVGHQAVNRAILAQFLFRRQQDVPYINIPQEKYYHIVSVQEKKVVELLGY